MKDDIKKRLKIIIDACEAKNADDIVDLDITGKTVFADHFVIVSGSSPRKLDAIKDEIEDKMDKEGHFVRSIEGTIDSGWIIMDYEDIIVHIFNSDQRRFYNIERLWSDK